MEKFFANARGGGKKATQRNKAKAIPPKVGRWGEREEAVIWLVMEFITEMDFIKPKIHFLVNGACGPFCQRDVALQG